MGIYLVYRTDAWHSCNSRELVYIGENLDDIIAQLIAYRGMNEDYAKEIRSSCKHSATTEIMNGK